MWSFLASVIVFVVLVSGLALWQRRTRKTIKIETAIVDQEMSNAAEIVQRRHRERFGRASTGLKEALEQQSIRGAPTTKP
jgi:Flp pilus assembly protein TadB